MIPSVGDNKNMYAGFSSAALSAFLVTEASTRLGVDLTTLEAGYIVAAVLLPVFYFARKSKKT
jgi:hypothetical protein